jgi:histidyl-tRNA synthetase
MDYKPIQDRNAKETTEAGKIAKFYGFQPIIPPAVEKQDIEYTKSFNQSSHPAEKAALLRIYFEERMASLPQPNMFYCERPFPGLKEPDNKRKRPSHLDCAIVSMGSSKSVCECLSIQTGITILSEMGYKDLEVEINSIGDKDSMNEFQKKLTVFVRKNFNSFSADLRQTVKKDLLMILKGHKEELQNFQAECPKSIDFLSESSRLHFKEMLEFLEVMNIPYQINHHLVGDMDIGSETIFSIKNSGGSPDEKQGELAYGFRFNRLGKKIGCKKDLPATILNISAKLPAFAKAPAGKAKKFLDKTKTRIVKPQFYLIQFGPEAKLKSFLILEELYKIGATVIHLIAKDKLGGQMSMAEASDIPYIILIGQKEALENSVVIRNSATRAQEIVPLSEFAAKIKSLI